MISLVLSILSASSLLIFFKLFERYRVDAPQAIAVNYIIAAFVGLLFIEPHHPLSMQDINWYGTATVLGFLFACIFNLSRYTTQKLGMGITSVSMKLGVVFPVLVGFLVYREMFEWYNLIGVGIGFCSIYFLTKKEEKELIEPVRWLWILPIIVWVGSGICDSCVQLAHKSFPISAADGSFTFVAFWSAGAFSTLFLIIKRVEWSFKSLLAGIVLGIPNYFSIYFLVSSLEICDIEYQLSSSRVFLINNIAVVLVSIIIGVIMFHEKLSRWNYLGIALSILAIGLCGI